MSVKAKRRPSSYRLIKKENRFSDLFTKHGGIDLKLLATIYILLAFGLIMIMSASSAVALVGKGDSLYFFKRQFLWMLAGSLAMFFMAKVDYHILYKYAGVIWIASVVLLAFVLIPGIGRKVNDARRWIYIGPISVQPSEFAKIATIIFLSRFLVQNQKNIKHFVKGVTFYFALVAIVVLLLICEPHLSCIILIVSVSAILIFVTGMKRSHILIIFAVLTVLATLAILAAPYRLARITTFIDPLSDPQGEGYQIKQSLYAIGSGGFKGMGLGLSRQKYTYLPEPQNDFIFAILCEELGFVGAMIVIALFVYLIYRGIKIATSASDFYGSLLATGITSLIALQVFINIGVVIAAMPVTGMPLPFFSYGGTSLAIIMASMGILLNISRSCRKK